jgi:hypothetical protein
MSVFQRGVEGGGSGVISALITPSTGNRVIKLWAKSSESAHGPSIVVTLKSSTLTALAVKR